MFMASGGGGGVNSLSSPEQKPGPVAPADTWQPGLARKTVCERKRRASVKVSTLLANPRGSSMPWPFRHGKACLPAAHGTDRNPNSPGPQYERADAFVDHDHDDHDQSLFLLISIPPAVPQHRQKARLTSRATSARGCGGAEGGNGDVTHPVSQSPLSLSPGSFPPASQAGCFGREYVFLHCAHAVGRDRQAQALRSPSLVQGGLAGSWNVFGIRVMNKSGYRPDS